MLLAHVSGEADGGRRRESLHLFPEYGNKMRRILSYGFLHTSYFAHCIYANISRVSNIMLQSFLNSVAKFESDMLKR